MPNITVLLHNMVNTTLLFLLGVIVLKFLGSVHKYNFYENEKHGTFAVYKNNKPIAYPTTIEQVLAKMEQVSKVRR